MPLQEALQQEPRTLRNHSATQYSFLHALTPDTMKSVHPIFHVSQLKLSHPSTILNRVQPLLPPIEVNREVEYEVEEIFNSKIDRRRCHDHAQPLPRPNHNSDPSPATPKLIAIPQLNSGHYINLWPRTPHIIFQSQA